GAAVLVITHAPSQGSYDVLPKILEPKVQDALPGLRLKRSLLIFDYHRLSICNDPELHEGLGNSRERPPKRFDRLADASERHSMVKKAFCSSNAHEVLKRVQALLAGLSRWTDEARSIPISEPTFPPPE